MNAYSANKENTSNADCFTYLNLLQMHDVDKNSYILIQHKEILCLLRKL